MRVTWVASAPVLRLPDGELYAQVASIRYRVITPLKYLPPSEFSSTLVIIPGTNNTEFIDKAMQADVIVFSKSRCIDNETRARKARESGAKIIFDICDNYYLDPTFGDHYKRMSAFSDWVVCNTEGMAQAASKYCPRSPLVIGDPYEGPRGAAQFNPGSTLKLLWFGNLMNTDTILAAKAHLEEFSRITPIEITIVTIMKDRVYKLIDEFNSTHHNLTMKGVDWSLEEQFKQLHDTDAVIIPITTNAAKNVKSANRMVLAFHAGKMVVANPLASYEPFRDWAWIGENLFEGLQWMLNNKTDMPARISAAQSFIDRHFSPQQISSEWEKLLRMCKPY